VKATQSETQPWWCRVWWPLITCQPPAVRRSGARSRTAGSKSASLSPLARRSNPANTRRQLLQTAALQGLYVQAYVPYGSSSKTATLPIPASLQPSFTGTVPNISYPDVATSALFNLAGGATTYFGLRFTGEDTGREPLPFAPCVADSVTPCLSLTRNRIWLMEQGWGLQRSTANNATHGAVTVRILTLCQLSRGSRMQVELIPTGCAGNLTVPADVSTNYTFSMDSDDGALLYVDKALLIDKSGALRRLRSYLASDRHVCLLYMQSISLRK